MRYLKGILKDADSRGSFTVVASTDTLDRDGEILEPRAFDPLPSSVPVHAFHRFDDPVGRGVPRYDGPHLVVSGRFASTPRAQEIRQLVLDGVIGHTSVGFLDPQRTVKGGVTHITKAELLEVSFVSVSANRDARVLAAKSASRRRGLDAVAVFKGKLALLQAELLLAETDRPDRVAAHGQRTPTRKALPPPLTELADMGQFLSNLARRREW